MMKQKYLTAIYMTIVLILLSAEPSENAPASQWLAYYAFILANMANAARLANKHFKNVDHETTRK